MEQLKLGIYKLKEISVQEIAKAYKHCINQIEGGSIKVESRDDYVCISPEQYNELKKEINGNERIYIAICPGVTKELKILVDESISFNTIEFS